MVVGVLSLEVLFPYSRSLKDKRRHLKSFKDRVRSRHNVSVAEVDFQDKWQRAGIAIAAVNNRPHDVEDLLNRILNEAEESLGGTIVDHRIDYF
jgi:uncharacterized protein YlxP (DUF503 family)